MYVTLRNGDTISAPLARFPRLLRGSTEQRNEWRVIGAGDGIRWPLLDEDISIRALFAERNEQLPASQKIQEIISIIGSIYAKADELSRLAGRPFTPDGVFVASTGRVVAEYVYGLHSRSNDLPLYTQDGRTVKVALAGRESSSISIRWTEQTQKAHAELLLCFHLDDDGFHEIYNGPFPVELLRDRAVSAGGQVKLSMAALSDLNPALLDKKHSLASINRLLFTQLANVA
jgi:hypothetical protein